LGTFADNNHDRDSKGRLRNGNARMSEKDIREIRRLYAEGVKPSTISRSFGLKKSHVNKIVHENIWKEL
jgi:DNA invertase Pin-like site-specific DNA recombinase